MALSLEHQLRRAESMCSGWGPRRTRKSAKEYAYKSKLSAIGRAPRSRVGFVLKMQFPSERGALLTRFEVALLGFMANGLVQQSLGQRPRNTVITVFLWPTAIFNLLCLGWTWPLAKPICFVLHT